MSRKGVIVAILIVATAFLLRVAWIAVVPVFPISDSAAYQTFARNLVNHGTYGWTADAPSAYWPIGTSGIYAALYAVAGSSATSVVIFNLAAGTALVALSIIANHLWFDATTGLISGALVALWPVFIQYTTIVGSEVPFAIAILIALIFFRTIHERTSLDILTTFVLGLVLGGAALLRPVSAIFPLVLVPALLWRSRQWRTAIIFAAVAIAGVLTAIGPWAARNYSVFGQLVPFSTSAGANLWMGNNPATTGFYQTPPPAPPGMNEAAYDQTLRAEALQYIRDEPLAFVLRSVVKALRLYERETIGVAWNAEGLSRAVPQPYVALIKLFSQAYWLALLAMFCAGCWIRLRRCGVSVLFHPFLMVIAGSTAFYAMFVIQDRYHIPTNPLMAGFAAIALLQLVRRLAGREPAAAPPEA